MKLQDQQLYQAIMGFELDNPDSAMTFTDRLLRENGWSMEFGVRAVFEYKRFMFLMCISSHPLTPSDEVDQVWHLHLLYTRSYWIDFCKETIQREIHHGPTQGGKEESQKFTNWYEKTKELYQLTFNEIAPVDLWPSSEIRFSEINFQRINLHRNRVIKKLFNRKK